MIRFDGYKDRAAVLVDTGRLCAKFLPEDGGKMASLVYENGYEFLTQAPGEKYLTLTREGSYIDSECSAFDDMFPTIDPYTPESGEYKGITYPDHGEVCRMSSECILGEDKVSFIFRSELFKTVFKKTVSADGADLVLDYEIENNGDEPFPYIWAAHCMIKGQDDAEIVIGYPDDAPIRKMFGKGEAEDFNRKRLTGFDAEKGDAYKFYYLDPIPAGYCGYRYASLGKTLMFRFDEKKVPYIGVWMNNGPFKGIYNLALEIATAPFDNPKTAIEDGSCSYIPAGDKVSFTVRISVE